LKPVSYLSICVQSHTLRTEQ